METVPHFPSLNAYFCSISSFLSSGVNKQTPSRQVNNFGCDAKSRKFILSWSSMYQWPPRSLVLPNWITVSEKLKFKILMTSMSTITQTLTHLASRNFALWWYNKSIIMLIVNENIILHQFLNHNFWQHRGTFSIFQPNQTKLCGLPKICLSDSYGDL